MREPCKGLKVIKTVSKILLDVPSISRRRSRGIKLLLAAEYCKAKYFLGKQNDNKVQEWLSEELINHRAKFYIKLFNSFFYLAVHLIPHDHEKYRTLKRAIEDLFEVQEKELSIDPDCAKKIKNRKVAIVYADMLGTVASASVSSLYCAARLLIYRQVFYSQMRNSSCAYVEVPIGDSLFALFKEGKNALEACLKILPYILENELKVVIGICYGDDFLSNSRGRPIIGRDTNLAVRASELGHDFRKRKVKVQEKISDKQTEKLVNGEEYYLFGQVDTAVWIADYWGREDPNGIFHKWLVGIRKPEGIKLVEYLGQESNIKTDLKKWWGKIGYRKENNIIYAFVPEKYLSVRGLPRHRKNR